MASARMILAFVLLLALSLPLGLPRSSRVPEPGHRDREVARLRAHFDSVDLELRRPTAGPLTPAQLAARETLVAWLREYRDAGRFPRNHRFHDRAMPFFRDEDGALCAMAYLIHRSGRADLVDRVASTRNNAFIPELAGDAELSGWLASVGLSVAEAARVQPAYEPPPEPEERGVSAGYALTSVLAGGASLATAGVNAIAPSRTAAWAGVLAGGAALVAGAAGVDGEGATDDVAAANLVAGAGAVSVGLYRLLAPSSIASHRVALGPLVMREAAGPRYGFAVRTTF